MIAPDSPLIGSSQAVDLGYLPAWGRPGSRLPGWTFGVCFSTEEIPSLEKALSDLLERGGHQFLLQLNAPAELALMEPLPLLQHPGWSQCECSLHGPSPSESKDFLELARQVLGVELLEELSPPPSLLSPRELSRSWEPEHPHVLLHVDFLQQISAEGIEEPPGVSLARLARHLKIYLHLGGNELAKPWYTVVKRALDTTDSLSEWDRFWGLTGFPEIRQLFFQSDPRVLDFRDAGKSLVHLVMEECRKVYLGKTAQLEQELLRQVQPFQEALEGWMPAGVREAPPLLQLVWAVGSHPRVHQVWMPWKSLLEAVAVLGLMRFPPLSSDFWERA